MIVRSIPDGVQLITQPDHAHLARMVMERCVPLKSHPRRGAILHAIAEHDNGWAEEDGAPTVDATGAVADFVSVPLSVRHAVVTPDDFGGARIPIEVTAREIHQRSFRSDAELRDAFRAAASTTLRGAVVGKT